MVNMICTLSSIISHKESTFLDFSLHADTNTHPTLPHTHTHIHRHTHTHLWVMSLTEPLSAWGSALPKTVVFKSSLENIRHKRLSNPCLVMLLIKCIFLNGSFKNKAALFVGEITTWRSSQIQEFLNCFCLFMGMKHLGNIYKHLTKKWVCKSL